MHADTDPRMASFRAVLDSRPLHRSQLVLCVMVAILLITDGYDAQAIGYVAPQLSKEWGLARGAFGPVFSAGLVGTALGALIFTPMADRLGARRILLTCVGFYALFTLLTVFVTDAQTLLWLRVLTGLGVGGAMPSGIALVSDYAPTRARTMMVAVAVCGFSLGASLGGLLAAAAMERFGWQSVFVVGGIIPLLMLPVLAVMLPESLPKLLRGPPAALAPVLARLAPGWQAPMGERAAAVRFPVTGLFSGHLARVTVLIWITFFCNLLLLYFLSSWLPTIVHDSGMELRFANLVTALYQGGGTIGGLLLAYLSDRRSITRVLSLTLVGATISVATIGLVAHEPVLLMIMATVAGFCVVGGQLVANAFAGTFYPASMRATGIGWALGIGRCGSILGPLIGAQLIRLEVSLPMLFQVGAVFAGIAALAVMAINRTATPKEAIVHG